MLGCAAVQFMLPGDHKDRVGRQSIDMVFVVTFIILASCTLFSSCTSCYCCLYHSYNVLRVLFLDWPAKLHFTLPGSEWLLQTSMYFFRFPLQLRRYTSHTTLDKEDCVLLCPYNLKLGYYGMSSSMQNRCKLADKKYSNRTQFSR